MKDFWISSGHHLLDRDENGGLHVTDEFLKLYLARPELLPPAEACEAERALHAALLANPRLVVASGSLMMSISDAATTSRGLANNAACSARSASQASAGGNNSGRAKYNFRNSSVTCSPPFSSRSSRWWPLDIQKSFICVPDRPLRSD